MRVCIPLPSSDFDPTETAVPFAVLSAAGHEVTFATPDGGRAVADDRMLTGRGLGPWRPILIASGEARAAFDDMARSPSFHAPIRFDAIPAGDFAAIVLPGGHAQGMRPYLESKSLANAVAAHMAADRVLGAICHGVLVAARAQAADGRSILHGKRTTALLESMELSAWLMTCGWLGNYYRTYPETVEHEVRRSLRRPSDFEVGPLALRRDSSGDQSPGFVVQDGTYVSARWPGDAYTFAHRLLSML